MNSCSFFLLSFLQQQQRQQRQQRHMHQNGVKMNANKAGKKPNIAAAATPFPYKVYIQTYTHSINKWNELGFCFWFVFFCECFCFFLQTISPCYEHKPKKAKVIHKTGSSWSSSGSSSSDPPNLGILFKADIDTLFACPLAAALWVSVSSVAEITMFQFKQTQHQWKNKQKV